MQRRIALWTAAALLATVASAGAQVTSIGPRFGMSVDPDQFVAGGQMFLGPLATNLYVSPSLEFGFGDDVTVIQVNGDLVYVLKVSGSLHPYFGGGVGLAFVDADNAGSDTNVGANLIGGLRFARAERESHFFVEGRFGIGDLPEFKILGGWNFAM